MSKKIIIIGAGPGGLSAGMILAHRGFKVSIYERKDRVGGRNSQITENGFKFELGPTFMMLPQVFKEVFLLAGEDVNKRLDLVMLEEMYRLRFSDGRNFHVYFDKKNLEKEIERLFPGESENYRRYFKDTGIKFDRLYRCLKVPYFRIYHYLRWKLLYAFPVMDAMVSIHNVLSRYFSNEDLKISMSFQSKYLGMSPWRCPGAFTILSYMEHAFGIFHPIGGVHRISEVMADIVREKGGEIFLNNSVASLIFDGRRAIGVRFEDGREEYADEIVMNADFAYGMSHLIPTKSYKKYSNKILEKKSYSCSTFMMYLGISGRENSVAHHSIIFSKNYKKNVEDISDGIIPEDPSFYIQNACVTDPTLAPEGKSTLYVLVPVPNLRDSLSFDWKKEGVVFAEKIISLIEKCTEFSDIRSRIEFKKIITPADWEESENIYHGAVFSLSHTIDQMLYLRPHNCLEGYHNLYLVGGGTHPGSGLPTILESGRITADLIEKKYKKFL